MEAATGMTAILNAITSVVSGAVSWIGSYLGVITRSGNEVLLLFVIFGFVGTGIGLIKRLTSL